MKQPQTHSNSPKFECNKDGFFEYLKACKGYDASNPNPWQEVADKVASKGYYCVGEEYACTDDLPLLQKHNESTKKENAKIVLDVAPNPFEGDVFNAKIIVLTLNPGFREKNRVGYNALDKAEKEKSTHYSVKNLELEGQGMYFGDKTLEKTRTYWNEVTKPKTVEGLQNIFGFDNADLAIIEHFGYPSVEYGETKYTKNLKTTQFAKDLVEFLATYRTDDFCFVIARRKDVWDDILQGCNKHVIELINSRSKSYISKGNVKNGATDWQRIKSLIYEADKQRQIKKLKDAIAKDDGTMISTYERLLQDVENGVMVVGVDSENRPIMGKIHP